MSTPARQPVADNPAETKQQTFSDGEIGLLNTSSPEDSEKEQQPQVAEVGEPTNPNLINGRSKGKIALIMLALCLAVFLGALDVTIVTTALPTISDHFQSSAGFTWIGSAFLLANAASIPSWGKISDIFGRKPMLLLANAIFMLGSLICAVSNNIGMLIAGRAVQGLGGGGLTILVKIVIGDIFPLNIRSVFYGVIGGVWAVAAATGPAIGGAFTEKVSWRWCFYINLPLDGLAFLIILVFLDLHTPRTPLVEGLKAIDWVGSFLVVAGTLMFLFGLEYGGVSAPWNSVEVICLLVFGLLTWGLFIFWEARYAKFPVMPMNLFRKISNAATLFCVFIQGVVFISASFFLPLYFQAVRGNTPIESGLYVLPTALSLSVGSLSTGWLVAKTGWYREPITFGLFMMTLGFGLFIDLDAYSGWAKLVLYQVVAGVGVGPLFQAPIIALHAHTEPRDVATATSTLGFIRQIAQAISVVIGQVVYQNEKLKQYPVLVAAGISPELSKVLSSSEAGGADIDIIANLPSDQRAAVRIALADSLEPMWIMYTCITAAGLLASFLIRKKVLTDVHVETKTGLEAERENAEARRREREMRKKKEASPA
ncbi:major facilitator superfamily domain-containing protein [Triangularia verruculosa]|uniref:Efflux pump dotC n=1 Tax=Triangularia verruculosa TaxID=2587418 RepID=A0AAN7AWJ4_9PEZI|nr:major facilitator superfamily domain-containing protein [Triangularia verruculosa]